VDTTSPQQFAWAKCIVAIAATGVFWSAPSFAHHSGAMFDYDKSITLAGTVKQFQWTNPHCWIELSATGEKGAEDWSVEMGAPLQLYQGGWKPGTLKPGDEIKVVVRPPRDGTTKAGLFVSATRADGSVLGKPQ
jgi:hypothetical protein